MAEKHLIKKVIILNVFVPFVLFLYTNIFYNVYNPYMEFPLLERILLGSVKNIFTIVFIFICVPCAIFIGYFLMPVKKAISDRSLIDKARKRIFALPIVVFLIYLLGFVSAPVVVYIFPMGVKLNEFSYVFVIALFSAFYGSIFSILAIDDILFEIKRLFGIHFFSDQDTKIPINVKLILTIAAVGLLIWSVTQYIGYYYFKKGSAIDTGDFFISMLTNVLIVLLTGCYLIWLIGKNINDMIRYIRKSVDEIIDGKGDLTKRINIVSYDEMGLLTSDFNKLFVYLGNMIAKIGAVSKKIEEAKVTLTLTISKNKEIFDSFVVL